MVTGTQQGTGDYAGLYNAMKVIFEEPIANALVQDTEAYDFFEQDPNIPVQQSKGGRYIELAHYAADGGGFGARREGGALPKATPPSIFNGNLWLRKNHMTVEMSGETMRRVQQGEASWLTWAKDALPNATRRLRHHLDRQSLGYAQGVLGRVSAIDAGNKVITVDRWGGLTGLSNAILLFARNDLIVGAADVNGVTVRSGGGITEMRIMSIDAKASTITVDQLPTDLVVNDYLAIGDAAENNLPGDPANQPKEIMGLMGIVDDGSVRATFQNQSRTGANAIAEYKAQVVDAATYSGGKFNEDLLLQADDDAFTLGGGQPDQILMHRSADRAYWKSLDAKRRGDMRGIENQGGKGRGFTIQLNGRDVGARVIRKLPPELAFMIERGTCKKWQNGSGFAFDTTTGSIFERVVTGTARYDAYFAVGTVEAELGNTAPLHNVLVKNITPGAA